MSTREYGDGLEQHVIDKFNEAGLPINRYNNSGAVHKNDSDLFNEHLQIECKRTGMGDKQNLVKPKISIKDWGRILKEARSRNKRPILVNSGNDVSEALVTLRLKDFIELYKNFYEVGE